MVGEGLEECQPPWGPGHIVCDKMVFLAFVGRQVNLSFCRWENQGSCERQKSPAWALGTGSCIEAQLHCDLAVNPQARSLSLCASVFPFAKWWQ